MARVIHEDDVPKRSTLASIRRRIAIGKAIRDLRLKSQIDVTTAAAAAGVSFHTWQRWEHGDHAIPLDRVADIRRALQADPIAVIRAQLSAA